MLFRSVSKCNPGLSTYIDLTTDARWIVRKEIARATIGVVGVSGLWRLNTRPHLWIGAVLAVGQVGTVVRAASLPSDIAWPASQRTVAAIAAVVVMAATGHGKGDSK